MKVRNILFSTLHSLEKELLETNLSEQFAWKKEFYIYTTNGVFLTAQAGLGIRQIN